MQNLDIERRVFGHPAQSASEKPYKFSELYDNFESHSSQCL